MAKGVPGRWLWYLCAQRRWEVWSVWRGVSAYWGAVNPQLWGLLFWEMAALGEADRVFIEHLHCSRHWGRGAKDKQGLFGGQLLCLGVPGCVLQASLCGCD